MAFYKNVRRREKQGYSEEEIKEQIEKGRMAFEKRKYGRVKKILKWIDFSKSSKILDLGCYFGLQSYYLASQNLKIQVTAIDIVPEFIEIAKKYNKLPNINYKCQDLLTLKEKNKYDYVIFLETIEHVDSPKEYLKKMFELLRPGGYLLISTPNALGLTNILLNIKRFFTGMGYIEKEPRGTGTEADHIYVWDKLTLFRLLNRCGFEYSDFVYSKNKIRGGQSLLFKVRKPL